MGNNHNQYFGKDKRKIIVVGLEGSGKTTLVNYILTDKLNLNTEKTKTLNIVDKKIEGLNVTFFDLGGSQRYRVFWKQQYEGTQGVIFVIDSQKYQSEKKIVIEQLSKLIRNIESDVPFCICLNKADKVGILGSKIKNQLQKQIQNVKNQKKVDQKRNFRIFELDFGKKDHIKQILIWFLKQTKPI